MIFEFSGRGSNVAERCLPIVTYLGINGSRNKDKQKCRTRIQRINFRHRDFTFVRLLLLLFLLLLNVSIKRSLYWMDVNCVFRISTYFKHFLPFFHPHTTPANMHTHLCARACEGGPVCLSMCVRVCVYELNLYSHLVLYEYLYAQNHTHTAT